VSRQDAPRRAPQVAASPFKSKKGWRRLMAAFSYSAAGLAAAWKNEHAFRQECCVVAPASVLALLLPLAPLEKLLLIGVLIAVLVVELLNSAIEAVVDRVSLEPHPLSKAAKDFGSAAVMLTCLVALASWAVIVLPLLRS
jgi:diacylglycerol kinase (ATP)